MAGIFCIFLGLMNLIAVWSYGRNEFQAIEEDSDNEDYYPKEGVFHVHTNVLNLYYLNTIELLYLIDLSH